MNKLLNLTRCIMLSTLLAVMSAFFVPQAAHAENSVSVVEAFNKETGMTPGQLAERDQMRRKIMFLMSVPLFIMLVATAVLGIMMAVMGKKVFVAHMILASLSLTLALVHGVVGIVWFFPF